MLIDLMILDVLTQKYNHDMPAIIQISIHGSENSRWLRMIPINKHALYIKFRFFYKKEI